MEIKYVGFYDRLRDGKQYRNYSLAAAKKMDFITSVLTEAGYHVRYISPAFIKEKGTKKMGAVRENVSDSVILELPPSRESRNKLDKVIRVIQSQLWLFYYLIKNTKKNEPVLIYHNYNIAIPVILAKKIKGFHIILEVEEKYSKVWRLTKAQKFEEHVLLKYVNNDSLFVSEILAKEFGVTDPVISYGSYNLYKGEIAEKCIGKSVILSVTGLIDSDRGSGFVAIEMMKYLPDNYFLKISGPVASKDRDEFFKQIHEMNKALERTACEYLGVLDDTNYERLLLSTDIALNPQRDGEFGKYVFPSKILTYFSYGIPVVSTRGISIVNSQIADLINFADSYDARDVANAVVNVKPKAPSVYQNRLKDLRAKFSERMVKTIKSKC